MSEVLTRPDTGWDVTINDHGVITINYYGVKAGWEQPVLLTSDAHFDHAFCDRSLFAKHLDWALGNNAPVIDAGDLYCAMQGKWDKRKSEDAMRPEYRGGQYLDKLVDEAAKFMEPYKDVLAVFGHGNHETAILKHHETDLTARLVNKLRDKGAPNLVKGDYAFWVLHRFWFNDRSYVTMKQFVHHGWGGGGPVTRGTIDTARMAVYLPDADIIHSGHVHHQYEMAIERIRLTKQGRPHFDTQTHIRTAGYKNEFKGNGWSVERGMAPRPLGGHALEFYVSDSTNKEIKFRSWRMT